MTPHDEQDRMVLAFQNVVNAAQRKLLSLQQHIHPQRLGRACTALLDYWGDSHAGGDDGAPGRYPRFGQELAALHSIEMPGVKALGVVWNRFALLSPADLVRCLCAVALLIWSDGTRRCIDRTSRRVLVSMVGECAMRSIDRRIASAAGFSGSALSLTERFGSSPASVPPQDLACWALLLLKSHSLITCERCAHLMELALAPGAMAQAHDLSTPSVLNSLVASNLESIANSFNDFFPELTWLFGCDTDRCLSV